MSSIEHIETSVGREPLSVNILNLTISINSNPPKTVIHPVSASIEGGTLFAILGGSGSGKTTLLNVIAGKYSKTSLKVTGSISFKSDSKLAVGYVTQTDYLLPYLTVKETLMFTARLQKSISPHTRETVVNNAILELGLRECSETLVASISGGQKRRVSVANQIISDPQILCADEPTSGLDSFTAATVIETLLSLSRNSRHTTIICSIHQPRADLFNLFDSILLLSRGGKPVYCGKTKGMISYFSSLGFDCPLESNPADFFVDLVSIDPRSPEIEAKDRARVKFIEEKASETQQLISETLKSQDISDFITVTTNNHQVVWTKQVIILTKRFYTNAYRNTSGLISSILQASCLGLVIMGIFYQLDESDSAIQSRIGLMYIFVTAENYIYLIIQVEKLCSEIKLFDRELQDNLYLPSAYFLGYLACSLPQAALQSLCYAVPIYLGCNLRHDSILVFLNFLAISIALTFAVHGLAWLSVSVSRIYAVASMISNLSYTFIGLNGGFLVNLMAIPVYLNWITPLNYAHYAYSIVMGGEFSNREFYDSSTGGSSATVDGNSILRSNGISPNNFSQNWPAMIIIMFVYHFIALILLNVLKYPPNNSVGGLEESFQSENDISESTELKLISATSEIMEKFSSPPSVLITIQNLSVSVIVASETIAESNSISHHESTVGVGHAIPSIRNLLKEPSLVMTKSQSLNASLNPKSLTKTLLLDINANIKPGRLVALMGGSGSGKTTLLNVIAGRVNFNNSKKSFYTSLNNTSLSLEGSFVKSGNILFNGREVEGKYLQDILGYVQQLDFHLPSLTVRETLQFHANLRLSTKISKHEKLKRVLLVAQLLGLKECLDVRVGSNELKGISGGEKRRLSVGVQLLLDPSVCILDEPTTGLDAFTARHVVETLQNLAHLGRTVILSIHQPRYDVFACLEDIILLARGRQVWSGPSADLMKHLEALNLPCPLLTNPADFILDITSIDFRSEEREIESRKRLQKLVDAYADLNLDLEAVEAHLPSESQTKIEPMKENRMSLRPDYIPFYHSLRLMLQRSYTNQIRQPVVISSRVSQNIFFALILSAFYAPVKHNQASVQNRIGNIYELTALTFIGMLNCIAVFPVERDVFFREYIDGGFSLLAFFLTYFIFAIPFLLFSAGAMGALLSFAIGLQPTGEGFGLITFTIFWFMFVGECIGVAFCSVFEHVGVAANVTSLVISIFCIMSGNISANISVVLGAINHISPLKYGTWIVNNTVFRGLSFSCSSDEISNGECRFSNGEDVLKLFNMFTGSQESYLRQRSFHMWILVVICIAYLLWAYLVLAAKVRSFQ